MPFSSRGQMENPDGELPIERQLSTEAPNPNRLSRRRRRRADPNQQWDTEQTGPPAIPI